MSQLISRRTALRGLGVAISLPWLEAMGPLTSSVAAAPGTKKAPNRLAFLYVPNGKNMADWTPTREGADFDLPAILQPLAAVKDDLLVLSGLKCDRANAGNTRGGDHARALAAFLTGCPVHPTDGTDIRVGISADQVAAARLGDQTRLASLEIGCEPNVMAGSCDTGWSCIYLSTMSWRSPTQPAPKEVNPKLVFERLFGKGPDAARAERDARRKSVLDFVREDTGDLTNHLGTTDRRKLDEYFSAVRDIEQRMRRAETLPPAKAPDYQKPEGIPASYEEHLRLMCDLLVLAFQADVTRVCTFVFANELSNRPYPFIGVRDGHHDLSHHENNPKKKEQIRDINIFHVKQLAYLLERLKAVREGEGTLLDHCMIAYGSGNSDGNRHNHDDLPVLVAGKGCGTLATGRHLRYPRMPVNNLWLSLLDRLDCKLEFLGDSTGRLLEEKTL